MKTRTKEQILEDLADRLRNHPDLPLSILNTIVSELNLEVMIDIRDALKDISVDLWRIDQDIRSRS